MSTCVDPIRLVPGPQGPEGEDGVDGTDGTSAFSALTSNFTMPAIGATANATMADNSWAVVGEPVHLQSAGTLIVTVVNVDGFTLTLQNPAGYPLNVAAATVIPSASKIGPSGFIGPAGANGAAGAGLTVALQGDLQTHDGANPANQAIGTNDQTLHADSTSSTGMDWRAIDLSGVATDLTGDLPVTEGGTGASSAAAAATNLGVLPLAGGTMTGVPTLSGTTPAIKWQETDAAANETRWEARADASDFKLQAVNDAESVRADALKIERTAAVVDRVTIAATEIVFTHSSQLVLASAVLSGNTYIPTGTVALVNGANADVALGTGTYFRITGPTGVFSISGIASGSVGGIGRLVILHNTVAFDLTITNDATSTASNRIVTLTGGDVTLTGVCAVKLLYDVTSTRWILLGTQG